MRKLQAGFTLIELMIVVAIIGILAAVALPAYQDYTIRAKLSEVVGMAAAAKTSVSEYYATIGNMPANPTTAGINISTLQSVYVKSVAYVGNGVTGTITFGITGLSPASGNLIFTGTGSSNGVQWICTNSTITKKYLPANCR